MVYAAYSEVTSSKAEVQQTKEERAMSIIKEEDARKETVFG
jgi:hypothetical protein